MTLVFEILKYVLALAMMGIGILHFVSPKPFVSIMPAWLPAHLALVYVSGVFEILGGLGLLMPWSQTLAAWGLVALFAAVLPANVNMAIHNLPLNGKRFSWAARWGRIPLQGVLMAWAYGYT
jgi:uncharacterized membrane protein